MYKYNWINTECDWCDEKKDCRGLESEPGLVVLTKCQDCDNKSFTTNANPKENAVSNYPGYQEALNLLEGNPFTIWITPVSGNYMTEVCDHDLCNEAHYEVGAEVNMLNEICCGEFPCDHWVTRLCDTHTNNNINSKETS
jgi:hypothetical protein